MSLGNELMYPFCTRAPAQSGDRTSCAAATSLHGARDAPAGAAWRSGGCAGCDLEDDDAVGRRECRLRGSFERFEIEVIAVGHDR